MGGNVFTSTHNVERIDQNTFNLIKFELSGIFDQAGIKYSFVKSVSEKTDHGDIDILVHGNTSFIHVNLNIPWSTNGDVTSILYKEKYQIDLIKTDHQDFKISSLFYDYNDFGNLVGRLIKKAGYKLTPKGLFYVHEGIFKNTEILLSKDPSDVLNILQLNVCEYYNGFNTFEDMFNYISKCPTFSAYPYRLENLSNSDRARDKKRKTYMLFLSWLDKSGVNEVTHGKLISPFNKFPLLESITTSLALEDNAEVEYRKIFNGNIVSELTGLKEKKLGTFMNHIRRNYTKDEIKNDLSAIVMKEFNEWI